MVALTTLVATLVPFFLKMATLYLVMAKPPAAAGVSHFAPAVSFPPGAPCTPFTLRGLEAVDSPLAGLTVGLLGSVAVYAPLYLLLRRAQMPALTCEALGLKLLLGVLVGLATWWRWAALEGAEIGVVLALSLLSVPIVLFLAPVVAGRHLEHVTPRLWAGAGLVVTGALTLVVA